MCSRATASTGHVVVTGQDSGVEGLQNIITGQQSMTVFKNVSLEANAAAKLAIALIAGKDPSAAGLTLTPFDGPEERQPQAPGAAAAGPGHHAGNIQDVVDAGALTTAEICKGIEQRDCRRRSVCS